MSLEDIHFFWTALFLLVYVAVRVISQSSINYTLKIPDNSPGFAYGWRKSEMQPWLQFKDKRKKSYKK